jgi:hypothetical protein
MLSLFAFSYSIHGDHATPSFLNISYKKSNSNAHLPAKEGKQEAVGLPMNRRVDTEGVQPRVENPRLWCKTPLVSRTSGLS